MKLQHILSCSFTLAAACLCGAAHAALENPPEDFTFNSWQKEHPPAAPAKRMALIQPVKVGELRLTPTYACCSVCWGSAGPVDGLSLEYRVAGGEWKKGETPPYFLDAANYRGSIFGLAEDTSYEMRLVSAGKTLVSGTFRTWKTDVPVAKTIVIDPATARYPIEIRDHGTPDGWIRYTTKPGVVLGGKDLMSSVFRVTDARYVLLDDMVIEGGGGNRNNAVFISQSTGVRVRNCELYGFGMAGDPRFTARASGKPCYVDAKGKERTINWSAGIMIDPGSAEVTVERCYIHDARGRSNSWYYSHPSGTEGIFVYRVAHSTVLRWNDIVGSDLHRWNDAIEGCDNFGEGGGFNRDADIYGNFCIYANDDCIELDGGMQNVRCFQNRFESAISEVSIQGCMVSPVYVFDNLLAPCCDEFGWANPCIKTSTFNPYWFSPYAGIWGNWFGEKGFNPSTGYKARMDLRDDNIFSTGEIPRDGATKYPVRDLPFILDTGVIKDVRVSGDAAAPASVTFTAEATCALPFRIRQNFDADWFAVTPSQGVLRKGTNRFTVTFIPGKMKDRRFWRSAFLVQATNGLSRCVSVYGERTDFAPPERPVAEGPRTIYAPAFAPAFLCGKKDEMRDFEFELKEGGTYWLFARAKGANRFTRAYVSLDGGEFKVAGMRLWPTHAVWHMLFLGKKGYCSGGDLVGGFKLEAGRHTMRIRGTKRDPFELLNLAVSDQPLPFEPR